MIYHSALLKPTFLLNKKSYKLVIAYHDGLNNYNILHNDNSIEVVTFEHIQKYYEHVNPVCCRAYIYNVYIDGQKYKVGYNLEKQSYYYYSCNDKLIRRPAFFELSTNGIITRRYAYGVFTSYDNVQFNNQGAFPVLCGYGSKRTFRNQGTKIELFHKEDHFIVVYTNQHGIFQREYNQDVFYGKTADKVKNTLCCDYLLYIRPTIGVNHV